MSDDELHEAFAKYLKGTLEDTQAVKKKLAEFKRALVMGNVWNLKDFYSLFKVFVEEMETAMPAFNEVLEKGKVELPDDLALTFLSQKQEPDREGKAKIYNMLGERVDD